jgi:hypothetical protein
MTTFKLPPAEKPEDVLARLDARPRFTPALVANALKANAARDLFDALQRFLIISEHPMVDWPSNVPIEEIRDQARAAIAKAQGLKP